MFPFLIFSLLLYPIEGEPAAQPVTVQLTFNGAWASANWSVTQNQASIVTVYLSPSQPFRAFLSNNVTCDTEQFELQGNESLREGVLASDAQTTMQSICVQLQNVSSSNATLSAYANILVTDITMVPYQETVTGTFTGGVIPHRFFLLQNAPEGSEAVFSAWPDASIQMSLYISYSGYDDVDLVGKEDANSQVYVLTLARTQNVTWLLAYGARPMLQDTSFSLLVDSPGNNTAALIVCMIFIAIVCVSSLAGAKQHKCRTGNQRYQRVYVLPIETLVIPLATGCTACAILSVLAVVDISTHTVLSIVFFVLAGVALLSGMFFAGITTISFDTQADACVVCSYWMLCYGRKRIFRIPEIDYFYVDIDDSRIGTTAAVKCMLRSHQSKTVETHLSGWFTDRRAEMCREMNDFLGRWTSTVLVRRQNVLSTSFVMHDNESQSYA